MHEGARAYFEAVWGMPYSEIDFGRRVKTWHARHRLRDTYRWVIDDLYGLNLPAEEAPVLYGHVVPMRAVAERLGLSTQRINQIKKAALQHIRRFLCVRPNPRPVEDMTFALDNGTP